MRKLPSPITILMIVVVLAALATWIIPSGKYNTLIYKDAQFAVQAEGKDSLIPFTQATLDSLGIMIGAEKFSDGSIRKPVSIPGTYKKTDQNGQGLIEILKAPVKGVYDSIDIIFFILVIGGFMGVFNNTGAMVAGMGALSRKMKGKESLLIIIFTFLFSFGGSTFGMAEEGFAFYPLLVPLFLAAGYDLLLPVAVIFAGTQLGTLSSFSNPFSTIIASNAAGVNWSEGLFQRLAMFIITTSVSIWYFLRYAKKIKADPSKSLVYQLENNHSSWPVLSNDTTPVTLRTKLLLTVFGITFLGMIAGVIFFEWWLEEMTTLFIGASILLAVVARQKETDFIRTFLKGAEELLGVALIVGVARGVTRILNDGNISDSIVHYSASAVSTMPPALFILLLLLLFMVFSLFIPSSSGMAVLTMPIMGALAVIVNVPGREIVNAYLYGMGIMGFITPTGLILPSLALVHVGIKSWLKFILPLMLILFIICVISLAIGIYYK